MRAVIVRAFCALALLAAAACSAQNVNVAAAARPHSVYGAPVAGLPNSLGHGRHNYKMVVGGIARYYSVQVPTGLTPGSSVPVIIALHGLAETYLNIESYAGLDAAAQKLHAVVVYPNGLKGSWNAGTCCGYSAANDVDDVGFIAAIQKSIKADFTVSRSFILGFSNGGMLAYRYLCEHPTDISGIGVAEATDVFTTPDGKQSLCKPAHDANVIAVQGLLDVRIPLRGGYNPYLKSPLMDVDNALNAVSLDHCKALPKTSSPSSGVTIYDGVGCAGGAERLVTVQNLSHHWAPASFGLNETATLLDWLFAQAPGGQQTRVS